MPSYLKSIKLVMSLYYVEKKKQFPYFWIYISNKARKIN